MGLTDLQVRRLAARERMYEEGDGKGLYIRVLPTGQKSWIFRYVFEGSRRRMVLGRYPSTSLAEARGAHGKALADVEHGINPGASALEAKRTRKAAPTFTDLLDEYWDRELKKSKTAAERRRLVEKDAIPAWGREKVCDIKRRDIVVMLDDVRSRAPVTANRLLGVLVRMFAFAAERGIIEDSPATRIRRLGETPRDRVLTDGELRLFWNGLDALDVFPTTKLALRFLLVTGQRPGEVTGLRWDEIEEDWWGLPPERMKEGRAHRVPLLPLAQEIIEQAKPFANGTPFVFTSSSKKSSKGHIRPGTLSLALQRHLSELGINASFTPHDLRRTVRTRLAELGVDDAIAEKVLGHQLQGVLKVYNRHGYDAEKRAALAAWETRLRRILGLEVNGGGKIINLRQSHPRH